MNELKPCPFCKGKVRISIRQMRFYGQNYFGSKKIKFGAQTICGRCKARGPLYTRTIIIPEDWSNGKAWLTEQAEKAWNRRADNGSI